jgi:hypothetical protein
VKVFKYTLSGSLLGSWSIDPANAHPTGITIDPTNVSDIWIVDSGTLKVYDYAGAASRTSGSQSASATFALAAGDTNPQGIADPPPDVLLTPGPGTVVVPPPGAAISTAAAAVASLADRDGLFALLVRTSPATPSQPSVALSPAASLPLHLDAFAPVADSAGTPAGTGLLDSPSIDEPSEAPAVTGPLFAGLVDDKPMLA